MDDDIVMDIFSDMKNSNSSTLNYSNMEVHLETDSNQANLSILVSLVYSIISVLSILGNGCFAVVTLRCKVLHSVTNFFMLHLSLANMLFVIVTMPTFFTRYLFQMPWKLGLVFCKVSSSMIYITVTASFHLMMVVAIDRQRALQSISRTLTRRSVHYAALGVWIVALMVALPYLYFYTVELEKGEGSLVQLEVSQGLRCKLRFPHDTAVYWHPYLTLTVIIVQFLVPLVVMIPCYSHMIWVLWRQGRGVSSYLHGNSTNRSVSRKKRTIIMLLLILLIFVVCWTPLFAVALLTEFKSSWLPRGNVYVAWMLCYILGMISVCLSPSVYLLSDTFRNELRKQLYLCCRVEALLPKERVDYLYKDAFTTCRSSEDLSLKSVVVTWLAAKNKSTKKISLSVNYKRNIRRSLNEENKLVRSATNLERLPANIKLARPASTFQQQTLTTVDKNDNIEVQRCGLVVAVDQNEHIT